RELQASGKPEPPPPGALVGTIFAFSPAEPAKIERITRSFSNRGACHETRAIFPCDTARGRVGEFCAGFGDVVLDRSVRPVVEPVGIGLGYPTRATRESDLRDDVRLRSVAHSDLVRRHALPDRCFFYMVGCQLRDVRTLVRQCAVQSGAIQQ